MKNHNLFLVLFTIFLIIVRCILNANSNLLLVVALLNLLALSVVILSIVDQAKKEIIKKAKESRAPKELVAREKKITIRKMYILTSVIFLVCSSLYLFFGLSELGNDIIAIISLGISLVDLSISNLIVKHIKF